MRGVAYACFAATVAFLLCVLAASPLLPQGPLDELIEGEEDMPRPPGDRPRPELPPRPAELDEPGVLLGEGFLAKRSLVQDESLGWITDIRAGELDPAPGPEIGIAGKRGALFLDDGGAVKAKVPFMARAGHVDIIDVEGDGVCEFMNRGGSDGVASLIPHSGRITWIYGGEPGGVMDMAAGDVDGDGRPEFAVGFGGGSGVHLLDADGARLWTRLDGNVWQVGMVDVEGRGHPQILHSNARGRLLVRDAKGDLAIQSDPDVYVGSFSLSTWPVHGDRPLVITAGEKTLWLLTPGGATVATLEAPHCLHWARVWAAPAVLRPDEPSYLAVVATFALWQRSLLYVYEPGGGLVYQETLEGVCQAVAAHRFPGDE
ncbi:MAG: VCBS repeat-containing protein, partial [Chloroflexi bacterium]|nr:VCBS repeat-containing protein [Chloroflexota bacterium]